jgi:hypothetical protein
MYKNINLYAKQKAKDYLNLRSKCAVTLRKSRASLEQNFSQL